MAFAEKTDIPLESSIARIIGMLRKAGADRIGQMEEPGSFTIQFFIHDRMVRFKVKIPLLSDMPERDGRGAVLSDDQRQKHAEQAARQRGRALNLVVKAKLESVESEVETFEEAFLANIVLADAKTLYERVAEPIALEYRSGKVAPLMLGGPQ